MRILLITPYFYPHIGGSQQYALELYRYLMKIDPSVKVDVICYNTRHSVSEEEYKGFSIYRIPCFDILKGQFAIPNYFDLWQVIKRLSFLHTYDIVNSHSRFFENSWWAPFVARYLKAKAVLTDHASSSPLHGSKAVTVISNVIEKIMALLTVRLYDLVTVTNKATLRYIKSFGIQNPVLVYGGVDVDYFNPKKREKIRTLPNIENKKFIEKDIIITFLGRMIYTKGPQLVSEAAKNITKRFKHVRFVFAGEGSMYKKLARVKNSQMYFVGSLNQSQVSGLLANTDVLANPSFHFEGFPNVLLEAGASGCAVVATDVGGSTELILHNKTGLIIKPTVGDLESAIVRLIKNHKKRIDLGLAIRNKIEKEFNWKNIAIDFKRIINQLIVSYKREHSFSHNPHLL